MADQRMAEMTQKALQATSTAERWRLAEAIARHGREGIRVAEELCRQSDASAQRLGIEILGRVDPSDEHLCVIASGLLTTCLSDAQEAIRGEVAVNLARLPSVTLVEKLFALRYAQSSGVRLAVALSLSASTPLEIEALIALSRDTDSEIRSWATFRLAESESDSDELRSALAERTQDSRLDVRGEALLGLVRRSKNDAVELISRELERAEGGEWVAEAALLAPSEELVQLLKSELERLPDALLEDYGDTYTRAIRACERARG